MKHTWKRVVAFVLALVMLGGMAPSLSLTASAEEGYAKTKIGDLDHGSVVSLPITVRNYPTDGMLFEWDGFAGWDQGANKFNTYEPKAFHNPYNTNDITEPLPYVGVNLALGQKFKDEWDLTKLFYSSQVAADQAYIINGSGNLATLTYHYGETYDSRYVTMQGGAGWNEATFWDDQEAGSNDDTRYLLLRYRVPDGTTIDSNHVYVKRYPVSGDAFETQIDVSVKAAGVQGERNTNYLLVGTEDGWTTIVVDMGEHKVKMNKMAIGFSGSGALDISIIATFAHTFVTNEDPDNQDYKYNAFNFINQDYCYRMDDRSITIVDPIPAIGYNVLMKTAFLGEDLTGRPQDQDHNNRILHYENDGDHVVNGSLDYYSDFSADNTADEPYKDDTKYLTFTGSGSAVARVWTNPNPVERDVTLGRGRYAAVRYRTPATAADAVVLDLLIGGESRGQLNTGLTQADGTTVLELEDEGEWRTQIIDLGYTGYVRSFDLGMTNPGKVDIAYAALFRDYDTVLTNGYNYNTNAHVFRFEDYSYRHDRVAYEVKDRTYKVYRDPDSGTIHVTSEDLKDPKVVLNLELGYHNTGTDMTTVARVANGYSMLNGDKATGQQHLDFSDNGCGLGVGFRALLLKDLNLTAKDVRYAVVSYRVPNSGTATGDTVPMYIILDQSNGSTAAGAKVDFQDGQFSNDTVTLGYFDAAADGRWHVDVLDLSECVSRSPNGETFAYQKYSDDNPVRRIGLADGWRVDGLTIQVAYIAMFADKGSAEVYGNAYSQAYDSYITENIPMPDTAATAGTIHVLSDAFTARTGQTQDRSDWEDANGNKFFRVGSNNGFELLDEDWTKRDIDAHDSNNNLRNLYKDGVPNYYEGDGFADWVKANRPQTASKFTNYNNNGSDKTYYNDDHQRDLTINGASGIYAQATQTYGYIMGLTQRTLGENGQPVYEKEVVEYVAQLLQKALNVPRTFWYEGKLYYSANYVQGDTDGERFGYYDEVVDGEENVNAMFPRDFAGWLRWKLGITNADGSLTGNDGRQSGGSYKLPVGSYDDMTAETKAKLLEGTEGIEALIASRDSGRINYMEAAYFMLNTLFSDKGIGHTVPEYHYLQLTKETSLGEPYYCFDTSYTNVVFDYATGVISNNGITDTDVGISETVVENGKDTRVAHYAFLPVLRELPEYNATVPYLRDNGIVEKSNAANSYYNRDFNFVMECQGKFTYDAAKDLYFTFDGDDDVYLYVNGLCVMDLGGGHKAANQTVYLNDYVKNGKLNLEDGKIYDFQLFFMERHGTGSNLRIETNIAVANENIVPGKFARQGSATLQDYASANFAEALGYGFTIKNSVGPYTDPLENFSFSDDTLGFYAGFDMAEGDLGSYTTADGTRISRTPQDLTLTLTDAAGKETVIAPQGSILSVDMLKDLLDDLVVNKTLPKHAGLDNGSGGVYDDGFTVVPGEDPYYAKFYVKLNQPNWFANGVRDLVMVAANDRGEKKAYAFTHKAGSNVYETTLDPGTWVSFRLYSQNPAADNTAMDYQNLVDALMPSYTVNPIPFLDGYNVLTNFRFDGEPSIYEKELEFTEGTETWEILPKAGRGLANGETLTLSGVNYLIGTGDGNLFTNTVTVRAGSHSGAADHHLVNGGGTSVFYAWRGHELDVPLADITSAGMLPGEADKWAASKVSLCSPNGESVNSTEVRINQTTGKVELTYQTTGVKQLYFKSSEGGNIINATVNVYDAADTVYVLDYDGTARLGSGSEDPFTADDTFTLDGVPTKLIHEAVTDEAPVYNVEDGNLSLDEAWKVYQSSAPAAETKHTVNLNVSGGITVKDAAGTTLTPAQTAPNFSQEVDEGESMAVWEVYPANRYELPPVPVINPGSAGVSCTLQPNTKDLLVDTSVCGWKEGNDGKHLSAYFFQGSTAVGWNGLTKCGSNDYLYSVEVPANATYVIIVRTTRQFTGFVSGTDNSYWDNNGGQTVDIPIQRGKRLVLDSTDTNGKKNVKEWTDEMGGYYLVSGRPAADVTVTFASSAYTVAINKGSMNLSPNLASQTVNSGNPIQTVTVSAASPFTPVPVPTVSASAGVQVKFTPNSNLLFVDYTNASNLNGGSRWAYFFDDTASGKPHAQNTLTRIQDNLYGVVLPNLPSGATKWTHVIIVRSDNGEYNWTKQTIDIPITASHRNCVYLSNEMDGGKYIATYGYIENTRFGTYTVSGTPTASVTVSFTAAGTGSVHNPGLRGVSPSTDNASQCEQAPFYYRNNGKLTVTGTDPVAFDTVDGRFEARLGTVTNGAKTLPEELTETGPGSTVLNFVPGSYMVGANTIYVTSRIFAAGATPTAYLGNANHQKELELCQKITVIPASVVYYEDNNAGVFRYNTDSAAGTITLTSANVETDRNVYQSASRAEAYGYDLGWAAPGQNSGGGARQITFTGVGELLSFDFTGTGFDLFGRTTSVNAPSLMVKIYKYDLQGVLGTTPVKTLPVITEFSNFANSASANPEAEAVYQDPLMAVTLDGGRYHVSVEGASAVRMSGDGWAWTLEKDKTSGLYYMVKKNTAGTVLEKWRMTLKANGELPDYTWEAGTVEPQVKTLHYSPAAVASDFWFDGLRVYNPLYDNPLLRGLYSDSERDAAFVEVRNLLLEGRATTMKVTDSTTVFTDFNALVEIRNDPETFVVSQTPGDIQTYFYTGPNNEVYLKGSETETQAVVLAVKSSGGDAPTLQIAARRLNSTAFGFDGTKAGALLLRTRNGWLPIAKTDPGATDTCGRLGDTEAYFAVDPTLCPKDDGGNYLVILRTQGTNLSLTKVKYKGWTLEKFMDSYEGTTLAELAAQQKTMQRLAVLMDCAVVLPAGLPAPEVYTPAAPWLHGQTGTCPGSRFRDMPAYGHWAHRAIDWALDRGITKGTSAGTFSPNAPATRAQVVTLLWRAAGCPEAEGELPFTDVGADAYCAEAVRWAAALGITKGTGGGRFSPNRACTRGEIVTLLHRWAGTEEAVETENPFTDVGADAYYAEAVAWAVGKGITKGVSAERFDPLGTCTRAQIVTFLYRQVQGE